MPEATVISLGTLVPGCHGLGQEDTDLGPFCRCETAIHVCSQGVPPGGCLELGSAHTEVSKFTGYRPAQGLVEKTNTKISAI